MIWVDYFHEMAANCRKLSQERPTAKPWPILIEKKSKSIEPKNWSYSSWFCCKQTIFLVNDVNWTFVKEVLNAKFFSNSPCYIVRKHDQLINQFNYLLIKFNYLKCVWVTVWSGLDGHFCNKNQKFWMKECQKRHF